MKNRELERAEFALKKINGLEAEIAEIKKRNKLRKEHNDNTPEEGEFTKEEYKNAVKKMLPLVQNSGLVATIAFATAKGKEKQAICNHLAEWLYGQEHRANLLITLVNCDSRTIMRNTMEAIRVLNWLKKMADGIIKD